MDSLCTKSGTSKQLAAWLMKNPQKLLPHVALVMGPARTHCLIILHYCNVTWFNIPLWIDERTWTFWGFFSIGKTLPKLHQINRIAYNNGLNATHGGTITSSNVYHKATKWFLHHMNGPQLLTFLHHNTTSLCDFSLREAVVEFTLDYFWSPQWENLPTK